MLNLFKRISMFCVICILFFNTFSIQTKASEPSGSPSPDVSGLDLKHPPKKIISSDEVLPAEPPPDELNKKTLQEFMNAIQFWKTLALSHYARVGIPGSDRDFTSKVTSYLGALQLHQESKAPKEKEKLYVAEAYLKLSRALYSPRDAKQPQDRIVLKAEDYRNKMKELSKVVADAEKGTSPSSTTSTRKAHINAANSYHELASAYLEKVDKDQYPHIHDAASAYAASAAHYAKMMIENKGDPNSSKIQSAHQELLQTHAHLSSQYQVRSATPAESKSPLGRGRGGSEAKSEAKRVRPLHEGKTSGEYKIHRDESYPLDLTLTSDFTPISKSKLKHKREYDEIAKELELLKATEVASKKLIDEQKAEIQALRENRQKLERIERDLVTEKLKFSRENKNQKPNLITDLSARERELQAELDESQRKELEDREKRILRENRLLDKIGKLKNKIRTENLSKKMMLEEWKEKEKGMTEDFIQHSKFSAEDVQKEEKEKYEILLSGIKTDNLDALDKSKKEIEALKLAHSKQQADLESRIRDLEKERSGRVKEHGSALNHQEQQHLRMAHELKMKTDADFNQAVQMVKEAGAKALELERQKLKLEKDLKNARKNPLQARDLERQLSLLKEEAKADARIIQDQHKRLLEFDEESTRKQEELEKTQREKEEESKGHGATKDKLRESQELAAKRLKDKKEKNALLLAAQKSSGSLAEELRRVREELKKSTAQGQAGESQANQLREQLKELTEAKNAADQQVQNIETTLNAEKASHEESKRKFNEESTRKQEELEKTQREKEEESKGHGATKDKLRESQELAAKRLKDKKEKNALLLAAQKSSGSLAEELRRVREELKKSTAQGQAGESQANQLREQLKELTEAKNAADQQVQNIETTLNAEKASHEESKRKFNEESTRKQEELEKTQREKEEESKGHGATKDKLRESQELAAKRLKDKKEKNALLLAAQKSSGSLAEELRRVREELKKSTAQGQAGESQANQLREQLKELTEAKNAADQQVQNIETTLNAEKASHEESKRKFNEESTRKQEELEKTQREKEEESKGHGATKDKLRESQELAAKRLKDKKEKNALLLAAQKSSGSLAEELRRVREELKKSTAQGQAGESQANQLREQLKELTEAKNAADQQVQNIETTLNAEKASHEESKRKFNEESTRKQEELEKTQREKEEESKGHGATKDKLRESQELAAKRLKDKKEKNALLLAAQKSSGSLAEELRRVREELKKSTAQGQAGESQANQLREQLKELTEAKNAADQQVQNIETTLNAEKASHEESKRKFNEESTRKQEELEKTQREKEEESKGHGATKDKLRESQELAAKRLKDKKEKNALLLAAQKSSGSLAEELRRVREELKKSTAQGQAGESQANQLREQLKELTEAKNAADQQVQNIETTLNAEKASHEESKRKFNEESTRKQEELEKTQREKEEESKGHGATKDKLRESQELAAKRLKDKKEKNALLLAAQKSSGSLAEELRRVREELKTSTAQGQAGESQANQLREQLKELTDAKNAADQQVQNIQNNLNAEKASHDLAQKQFDEDSKRQSELQQKLAAEKAARDKDVLALQEKVQDLSKEKIKFEQESEEKVKKLKEEQALQLETKRNEENKSKLKQAKDKASQLVHAQAEKAKLKIQSKIEISNDHTKINDLPLFKSEYHAHFSSMKEKILTKGNKPLVQGAPLSDDAEKQLHQIKSKLLSGIEKAESLEEEILKESCIKDKFGRICDVCISSEEKNSTPTSLVANLMAINEYYNKIDGAEDSIVKKLKDEEKNIVNYISKLGCSESKSKLSESARTAFSQEKERLTGTLISLPKIKRSEGKSRQQNLKEAIAAANSTPLGKELENFVKIQKDKVLKNCNSPYKKNLAALKDTFSSYNYVYKQKGGDNNDFKLLSNKDLLADIYNHKLACQSGTQSRSDDHTWRQEGSSEDVIEYTIHCIDGRSYFIPRKIRNNNYFVGTQGTFKDHYWAIPLHQPADKLQLLRVVREGGKMGDTYQKKEKKLAENEPLIDETVRKLGPWEPVQEKDVIVHRQEEKLDEEEKGPVRLRSAIVGYAGYDLERAPEINKKDIPACIDSIIEQVKTLHSNGILSRDIKPQNILYFMSTASISYSKPCLVMDFGAGVMVQTDGKVVKVVSAGLNFTPQYFPEILTLMRKTGQEGKVSKDAERVKNAELHLMTENPVSLKSGPLGESLRTLGPLLREKLSEKWKSTNNVSKDNFDRFFSERIDIFQTGYMIAYMLAKQQKTCNYLTKMVGCLGIVNDLINKLKTENDIGKRNGILTALSNLFANSDQPTVTKMRALLNVAQGSPESKNVSGDEELNLAVAKLCLYGLYCAPPQSTDSLFKAQIKNGEKRVSLSSQTPSSCPQQGHEMLICTINHLIKNQQDMILKSSIGEGKGKLKK